MEPLIIWFVLAIAVGYGASQKGRNGFGWFLVALIFSPLIGGLFVLAMKAQHVAVKSLPAPDHAATLASLASLHDTGTLTDAEYAAKKAEVLARV